MAVTKLKQRNAVAASGFTLVELLVVIAIIGLVASIVLVSLNPVRMRARDSRRKADFRQLQTALELYQDKYNTYPAVGGGAGGICNGALNEHNDVWCRNTRNNNQVTQIQNWIPGLEEFVSTMPQNPKMGPAAWPYPYHYYSPSSNQYVLVAGIENLTDPDSCAGGAAYTWFDGAASACQNMGGSLTAPVYVRIIR